MEKKQREQDRKIEGKRGRGTRTDGLTEKDRDREEDREMEQRTEGQRGKHEWEEGQGI